MGNYVFGRNNGRAVLPFSAVAAPIRLVLPPVAPLRIVINHGSRSASPPQAPRRSQLVDAGQGMLIFSERLY